jgi:hypothetical protein
MAAFWSPGGWDNNGDILTSAEIYDPASAAWLPAATLRNARAGHAAITLPDGRVLVVGGCFGSQASGAVSSPGQPWDVQAMAEVYDPRANSWQAAGQLAEGRCWPTATLLADGRVLVVGGSDRTGRPVAGAELYDPNRNSWSSAGRLRVAREGHTATLLPDGQVLVAGGYNGEALASTELYNPAANTWTPTTSMHQARAYHTAALLQNGKVLVIGGATGGLPSQDTEAYDPRANTWTPAGPLPAPYAFHLTTVLANGLVVVTGRPGSNDPTGNDGYPTPIGGAQTPTPRGTPGIPGNMANTPNRGAAGSQGMNAAEGGEGTTPTPPAPVNNVTTGVNTARLYGVHEVSFTLPAATDSPYGLSYSIIFTGQNGASTTVKAFYDGPAGSRDKWVARVYVNQVGTWTWQAPGGASNTPCGALACSFVAVEEPDYAQLHGMLRVTSGNEGKRWYTDDGQTFLPKADTAYRLFMEVPASPQANCPIGNLPMQDPAAADSFVAAYADSAKEHGINVLRALALGNWAYSDSDFATPTPGASCATEDWKCQNFVGVRLEDCLPDLSLYFSNSPNGSSTNLFDGGPEHAQIQPGSYPNSGYYPNLHSFQRTDRKLKLLLNEYPSMYIQVLLVTEPYHNARDTEWREINTTLRTQLWQNMIARWGAFPNVFWSVSNDLGDTSNYPDNLSLANEIGCYWMGGCNGVGAGNDPWRANRPMSMGHLRNRIDGSIAKTWHTYITAYSYADISAQQMDGSINLDSTPTPVLHHYVSTPKPVYDTEDMYEGYDSRIQDISVRSAPYFFRKLFWSYLLSGGGTTYGSNTTWAMEHVYDGGTYSVPPTPGATPTVLSLTGLDNIGFIDPILHQARIDLARLSPHDELMPQATPGSTWTEYERAQVAGNDQEILAYIPNTLRYPPNQEPGYLYRRKAEESQTTRSVTVDMTAYHSGTYRVTWYEPATGAVLNTGTIPGNSGPGSYRPTFTPPPNAGDVVLHISSRCESPNACEPMDEAPPTATPTAGFQAGADLNAELVVDGSRIALGYPNTTPTPASASWRCDRLQQPETGMPGCWVRHDFPNGRSIASAEFYFRRNSRSSYQGLYFITTAGTAPGDPIVDGEHAISLDVWFNDAGDLYTGGDQGRIPLNITAGVAPDPNRWYRLSARAERTALNTYLLKVYVDGVLRDVRGEDETTDPLHFTSGDAFFRRTVVHTAWWVPTTDLPSGSTPAVWWDELSIDPPAPGETVGLYRTTFQQGLGGYTGNHAVYFSGGNGVNNSALLKVGANNTYKTLLWFNTSSLPSQAIVDEATLDLYYTGRDNGNTLTLGAHRVLGEWIDSEVTHFQRKAGINWVAPGMGSGSDYTASPEATLPWAASPAVGCSWTSLLSPRRGSPITPPTTAWCSCRRRPAAG